METPYLLIDNDKLTANIHRMSAIAKQNGVHLRPHVKTHKIPQVATMQLAQGATGITVAKVSEAEVMKEHGMTDIFIAYPLVVTSKIERALNLARDIELTVGVDSFVGARTLSSVASHRKQTLNVRMEVDTGLHRTGIASKDALSLAQEISRLEGLQLTGIYTYRGALLNGKPTIDTQAAGVEEGMLMVEMAQQLQANGIDVQEISVGSTPTAPHVAEIQGVTEIRPGTYVFGDVMQAAFGAMNVDECAAFVVVTVVSRPSPDLIVVDGGSKTFATDVQLNAAPLYLEGFGRVLSHPEAVFERMTEEHGMIRILPETNIDIGDELHILPNHICSTVNLHNFAYMRRNGGLTHVDIAARGKLD